MCQAYLPTFHVYAFLTSLISNTLTCQSRIYFEAKPLCIIMIMVPLSTEIWKSWLIMINHQKIINHNFRVVQPQNLNIEHDDVHVWAMSYTSYMIALDDFGDIWWSLMIFMIKSGELPWYHIILPSIWGRWSCNVFPGCLESYNPSGCDCLFDLSSRYMAENSCLTKITLFLSANK